MFIIDQTIQDVKIRERNIFKLFFSMNNHQVATPEMMLEDARSYIMIFREAQDKISAYIGLHLLLTERKLFYAHSSNPFPAEQLEAVEEEAIGFAEGLGAMIDELDLTKLSPEELIRWIDRQEIFKSYSESEGLPETREEERRESPAGHQAREASLGTSPLTEQAIPPKMPLQIKEKPAQVAPQTQQVPHPPAVPAMTKPQTATGGPPVRHLEEQPTQPSQPAPQAQAEQPAPQQPLATAPEVQPPQKAPQPSPSSTPSKQQTVSAEDAPQSPPTRHGLPASNVRAESPEATQEEAPTDAPAVKQYPAERKMESRPQAQRTLVASPEGKQVKPPSRMSGPKTPPTASPRGRQELYQQALNSGGVKVPKTAAKKGTRSADVVISREREALARLLTSF